MAKVFLSFKSQDIRKVWTLRGLSEFKNVSFEMDDVSLREAIKSRDKYYIRSVIAPKIRSCTACVCLIGEDTHRSRLWVPWEIELAVEEGKKVLGMKFWDTPNASVPSVLINNHVTVFNWDVDRLFRSIGG